jgi:hypothetical protein
MDPLSTADSLENDDDNAAALVLLLQWLLPLLLDSRAASIAVITAESVSIRSGFDMNSSPSA